MQRMTIVAMAAMLVAAPAYGQGTAPAAGTAPAVRSGSEPGRPHSRSNRPRVRTTAYSTIQAGSSDLIPQHGEVKT